MSNYSVLLYKNTDNPDGIPGDWPATVQLLPDDVHTVDPPHQIMSDTEYNEYINSPFLASAMASWKNAEQGIFNPVAKIVVTEVTCGLPSSNPAFPMFKYEPNTESCKASKVQMLENMPVTVKILIRDLTDSYTLPITDGFALPVLGEGMPTQLLFVSFVNGEAMVNLDLSKTGVYEITQDDLNRELPSDSTFAFDGMKIYVLKSTALVDNQSPTSFIITEEIVCELPEGDPRKAVFSFTHTAENIPDVVKMLEGTPIVVTVAIKDPTGTSIIPVNDSFALPITGEGVPTQLILVRFVDGIARINLKLDVTGLYEINQDIINRELPAGAHFKFCGVKLYVLKAG